MPGPGDEVAGYRLERLLGRGGMGVVFLARHPRLNRRDALKLLPRELAEQGTFRERFLREADLACSLDHPNVVTVYDRGEADGWLYIDMQYVPGGTLRELLDRDGRLAPARAVAIVTQLASALDAAHRLGLVHRDVKPENVLVAADSPGEDDRVLLADFGITRLIESSGSPALTRTGELLVSPAYAAPELVLGEQVSERADVYSLGCMFVELLTGEVPFPRSDPVSAVYAHVREAPPPVSSRVRELPRALDPVVARALAKTPAERYASCRQFATAAAGALSPPRIARPAPPVQPSPPTQVTRRPDLPPPPGRAGPGAGAGPRPPAPALPPTGSGPSRPAPRRDPPTLNLPGAVRSSSPGDPPSGLGRLPPHQVPDRRRGRRWWWLVAALIALAVGAGLGYLAATDEAGGSSGSGPVRVAAPGAGTGLSFVGATSFAALDGDFAAAGHIDLRT
jgi:serine/threonine protein kinase